jgi:hypothetical protein
MPRSFCRPELLPADVPPDLLCCRAYPGHRKGCPNYGKRDTCPPTAQRWTPEFIDAHLWVAVWNKYAFADHVAYMRRRHPAWSKRQLECCLYWQKQARAQLQYGIDHLLRELTDAGRSEAVVWKVPEAHGVNITATMASLKVTLEWPPIRWAYQVALISFPRIGKGA